MKAAIYAALCLGIQSAGDPAEDLLAQLDGPVGPVVDEIWGSVEEVQGIITRTEELIAGKPYTMEQVFPPRAYRPIPTPVQLGYYRDMVRKAELAKKLPVGFTSKVVVHAFVPAPQDYWNPLYLYAQNGSRPLLAHMFLKEPNNAPTSEAMTDDSFCYWVRGIFPFILSRFHEWHESATLDTPQYQRFLQAGENRPGEQHSQNFEREALIEIMMGGPEVEETDELLFQLSRMTRGLAGYDFKPEWQDEGPFDISMNGRSITIQQTPGTKDALRELVRWIAMDQKTAEYQLFRRLWPIIGYRMTPRVHGAAIKAWMASNGDLRECWKAVFKHPEFWSEVPGKVVENMEGMAIHHAENQIPYSGKLFAPWQSRFGLDFGKTPDAKGYPRDLTCISSSLLRKRLNWAGTPEQQRESLRFAKVFR